MEDEEDSHELVPEHVSCRTALDCIQTVITYFEQQPNTLYILQLHKFQSRIHKKEREFYEQKMTECFKN